MAWTRLLFQVCAVLMKCHVLWPQNHKYNIALQYACNLVLCDEAKGAYV